MTLSRVAFTLADRPVDIEGWNFNDTEGGYDQCSGVISEKQYRAVGAPTQGATVMAYSESGEVRYAGQFAAPPQIKQGRCHFNAVGFKEMLEKKGTRLFIQSADMSQWVPYDSAPHLNGSGNPVYEHDRRISVEGQRGALRFKIDIGQQLVLNSEAVLIFYAEGVDLFRVEFDMNYATADEATTVQIRTRRANGPTGTPTGVDAFTCSGGNNGTRKGSEHSTVGQDLWSIGLQCNNGAHVVSSSPQRWMVTNVRVNSSVTSADSFNAYAVVNYIADEAGWDTTGIVTSSFDILPFDWQDGSWLGAMLYVAELEDKFARVGNEAVEYDEWGTTNWTVTQADGADADLKPLELFNQARVAYDTPAGVRRKITRDTADVSLPDPLAGVGITNTYDYDLEDRQKSSVVPTAVADKLVRRFSQQRYAGSVQIVSARSNTGSEDPRAIRYGDTLTVTDWGPGASQVLRVTEVNQDRSGVTVGVEQPVNLADLLRGIGRKRGKRGSRHRGGYHGNNPQAGP